MNEPIEVEIVQNTADVFVVWVKTRGRHTPLAASGTAGHAEIVQAALNLFAEQRPEMLHDAINTLPRACVPCAHEQLPPLPAGESK